MDAVMDGLNGGRVYNKFVCLADARVIEGDGMVIKGILDVFDASRRVLASLESA